MAVVMNAIMAWCAGYESGVFTALGGSRVKNIRGIARVCPRELRRVPSSTVPRHLLSRQRTKSSLYDQVRDGWETVVGAKAKAWTLGKLATEYAWMSSAQSFHDLRAVD